MKNNVIPKSAVYLVVAGLLITTLSPILCRYLSVPDYVRGSASGIGIAIECFGLIKINQANRSKCTLSWFRNAGKLKA